MSASQAKSAPLLSGLAWGDGAIIVEDDARLHRVRRTALSPSTAGAITSCPARYVGDSLLPRVTDLFSASELGTVAHLVLERLYLLPPHERTREAAAKIMDDLANERRKAYPDVLGDENVFAQWVREVSSKYLGIFEIETPSDIDVCSTERKLADIQIGGIPFIGTIDRVRWMHYKGERRLVVDDYKTGNAKPAGKNKWGQDPHGDQIRLYGAAVTVVDGEAPCQGTVLYTSDKQTVSVPMGKEFMTPTLDWFKGAWEALNTAVDSRRFEAVVTPLCGWCPLIKACPSARAARKYDRSGAAYEPELLGIASGGIVLGTPDMTKGVREKAKQRKRPEMELNDQARAAIIGSAMLVVGEQRDGETPQQHVARQAYAAASITSILISDKHPVNLAIDQVAGARNEVKVFAGTVRKVEKEESSTRGIVTLFAKSPNNPDGGLEQVKTDRTDNLVGLLIAKRAQSLVGHRVVVRVEMEPFEDGRDKKNPNKKMRVLRWLDDLGVDTSAPVEDIAA